MTNILYIGPYRYNNFIGISSRDIIEGLAKNSNVDLTTKNIFLDNPYDSSTLVNYTKFEKKTVSHYDIVIEHTSPSMMSIDHNISDRFVAIPIIDYVASSHDIDKLRTFHDIYIDDFNNLNILQSLDLPCKIFSYEMLPMDHNNTINIDYHNFNKKFYFIGSYGKNQNTINKIIVSFLMSFRHTDNISLVLMLTESNKQETEKQVFANIQDIFDKMDFHPILSPIKVIIQPLSIQELHTIHSSFDVHLDIRDSYDTGINRHLAALYNKKTVDARLLKTIPVPSIDLKDGNINKYKQSVLTQSIVDTISDTKIFEKTKIKPEDTISKLLCI